MSRFGFSEQRIAYFAAKYTQTMVCFFHGNRHFGRLFLALLLAHCPSNVCFLMWIVHGLVKGFSQIFIASFFFFQTLAIFGVHLMFALCIKVIHKPANDLFHLMASSKTKRNKSLRSKLKLHNMIMAIHTKNRYGFTYANFGLVTLKAFSMVSAVLLSNL